MAKLNDDILSEMDSSWDDPFGPRRTTQSGRPAKTRVAAARQILRENYEGTHDIVLKEPRIAVLNDIWRAALEAEGFEPLYIIMVRSPYEVAASLKTRDGMAKDKALLLWTTYMLASEHSTRGRRRLFATYDDLLANPDAILDRVEASLDIVLTRRSWSSLVQIRAFIDPEHRHERIADSGTYDSGFEPVETLYTYLKDSAHGAPSSEPAPKAVGHWMESLANVAAPMVKRIELELTERLRTVEHLHHHALELQRRLDERVAQAEAQQNLIQSLEASLQYRVDQAVAQQAIIDEINSTGVK